MQIKVRCTSLQLCDTYVMANFQGMFTQDLGKSDPILTGTPGSSTVCLALQLGPSTELHAGHSYILTIQSLTVENTGLKPTA